MLQFFCFFARLAKKPLDQRKKQKKKLKIADFVAYKRLET